MRPRLLLVVASAFALSACGGSDTAAPAASSAVAGTVAPSEETTVGDVAGTTPTPTAEEQADLITRLQGIYPGLDEEDYVDESRNTCRGILEGNTPDELRRNIPLRFTADGVAAATPEQADAIATAIRETFCDSFD